jgi:hypothetical protein
MAFGSAGSRSLIAAITGSRLPLKAATASSFATDGEGSDVGVDPPYLFGAGGHVGSGLSVVNDVDSGVIEVTVDGRWSRRLCLDVYSLMRKCLAEHPAAVIVDLRDLSDLDAASATMWLAVSRAANALQPPAQLVLSMPPTRQLASRLRRLGAVWFLPIFVTMRQARAAVASRLPLTDRLDLSRLPPAQVSVGAASDLVGVACDAWALPALLEPSQRVLEELVTNAVEHAGTDMAVTVCRRGAGLYLAVRDGDPGLPYLLDPAEQRPGGPATRRGGGLRMVNARSSAWGAMPARNGKVVWAIVRPRRTRVDRA